VKITYLELAGFRSFGTDPQRLDIASPLLVIHADNSQGKTSLAEALEFLLTGATSRRQLSGGSLQEYSHALRNVHMSADATQFAGPQAR
jgi:recombinational DNA repair ATPase RecF